MSDYAMQAEAEMWDAIAAQPDPVERNQSKHVGGDGRLRYDADGSEVFPGATGVRQAPAVPVRCAAHDRYDDCPDASVGDRRPVDRCYCPGDCRCHRETNAPCGCKRH